LYKGKCPGMFTNKTLRGLQTIRADIAYMIINLASQISSDSFSVASDE
jgi:hypothetical protein